MTEEEAKSPLQQVTVPLALRVAERAVSHGTEADSSSCERNEKWILSRASGERAALLTP